MTLLQQATGSIIRFALAGLAGYFVHKGIWAAADANAYVNALAAAITLGGVSLGWSLWQKYASHISFLTALESPAGSTPAQVQAKLDAGMGAKLSMVLLVIGLGALLPLTGCAKNPAPSTAPNAKVVQVLNAVRQVGVVVQSVQAEEIALHGSGVISDADHALIQKGLAETSAAVLQSLTTLQQASAAQTPRQIVASVDDGLKALAQTLGHLSTKQAQQLGGYLDTAAQLLDLAIGNQ